jgi:colanic acid biosynthesis glycosyl transferase WcaI
MGAKQGLEDLPKIIQSLSKYKDILFILCGEGVAKERLQNDCKEFNNTLFLKLQPESKLPSFLKLADIHIMPQKQGAHSLVMPSRMLGMMASGKPIVAMAEINSDVKKIIDQCGITVKPGDHLNFSRAILKLYKNKALRLKMGLRANQIVKSEFDRNKILFSFENRINELVNSELDAKTII